MTKKYRVYLNEYNVPTNNTLYLPYSTGLLRAYAESIPEIKENFEFQDFLFIRDDVDSILANYVDPDVVAFSAYSWNFQLSLTLARRLKELYPDVYIIFGGPNVPRDGTKFFQDYPFINVGVFGEGEVLFADILLKYKSKKDVPHHVCLQLEEVAKDLDTFLSPYTTGLFDSIVAKHPEIEFKTVIETNRACPFSCTFCFWGQSAIDKKIAYHSLEYIEKEARWIAENKIAYVFCSDANFGMFKRDIDIARIYAGFKSKYNYPEKFRVAYGKNAGENVYQTAVVLSQADLAKTVTLAVQSHDETTLKNIRRSNIKLSVFQDLQRRYTEAGIPTYSEIILGLPGETKESFLEGVDAIISAALNNQVFIYHCIILPNTEMSEPEYLEKHKVKTVTIPLAEVHGNVRLTNLVQEYETIAIGTESMTIDDWRHCAVISWIAQLCHGLKIGFNTIEWLVKEHNINRIQIYHRLAGWIGNPIIERLWDIATGIIGGKIRCQHDVQFGPIYYEPEEMAFLKIAYNRTTFFSDMYQTLSTLVSHNHYPTLQSKLAQDRESIPYPREFKSPEEYATNVILRGRKSNKLTTNNLNLPFS